MDDHACKPRLLVLASTYPRWQGDHEPGFVHELSRRLVDRFEVTVLGPHAPGAKRRELLDGVHVERYRYAPERLETLVNDGGVVANLRRHRWKWLLVLPFVLAQTLAAIRLARRLRPHVVHAHWLLPQGLVAAVLRRAVRPSPPFVVTSHGADLFALRAAPLQAAKRWVARQAKAVTVVSEPMRSAAIELGVPRSSVSVQPMGVDLSHRFTPAPVSISAIAGGILFVGRLVEKKGVRHLVDALAILARAPAAPRLTIAGFGPEERGLRAQAEALGIADRVDFVGAVPQHELPELYRRAEVFVAPYVVAAGGDQEGLGLVAVEALGCGTPVVLSDLDVVRSAFDGLQGVTWVVPSDSLALAAAIEAARGTQVGDATFSAIRARFDWNVCAERYGDLLSAVIGAPDPLYASPSR